MHNLARVAGIAGLVGLVLLAAGAAPASAVPGAVVAEAGTSAARGGGDMLYPARDRYEPGQTATMLGYGHSYADQRATWRTTQFHGYLLAAADLEQAFPPFPGVRVGPVVVQEVPPFRGRDLRVSIEFPLPADLAPGEYLLDLCDDPCVTRLGYFMQSVVHVGVDPDFQVVRDWPLTDPAIRWLEDDALVAGPTFQPVRAADVRAGRIPAAPPLPPALPPPDAAPSASNAGAPAAGQADTPAAEDDGSARPRPPGDGGTAGVEPDTRTGPEDEADASPVSWPAIGLGVLAVLAAAGVAVRRARRRPGSDDGAPHTGEVPLVPYGAAPPEIEHVASDHPDDPVTVGGAPGSGRSRVRIHL